ncbi:hypothetical protein QJQ45_015073 [Haematococcus lacustris]|nr:hypothetical protein QJQ45_015073 [Haematococcus lacustris]
MGALDALALCWALARVLSLSQAAVALTLCRWLLGLERVGSLLELGRRCVTAGAAACFRHTWLPEKRRAFQLLAMSEQWLARRDQGVVLEDLGTQGAVQGLWVRPASQRPGERELWVLYVHGGAMVAGASGMYARSFTRLVQQLQALGVSARLLSVEYPLAPEQPHPAALQATLAAWRHLLQCSQQGQGKACYAIMGDSAGGNLALACLMALHEQSQPQPQPNCPHQPGQTQTPPTQQPASQTRPQLVGAVLISPWLDLSPSSHSHIHCGSRWLPPPPTTPHIWPCTRQGLPPPSPRPLPSHPAGPLPGASQDCPCWAAQRQRLAADMLTPGDLRHCAELYAPGRLGSRLVSPAVAPGSDTQRVLREMVAQPVLVLAGGEEIMLPDIQRWADSVNQPFAPLGRAAQRHAAAVAMQALGAEPGKSATQDLAAANGKVAAQDMVPGSHTAAVANGTAAGIAMDGSGGAAEQVVQQVVDLQVVAGAVHVYPLLPGHGPHWAAVGRYLASCVAAAAAG